MILGFWFCRGWLEEERNALLQIKESINSPEGTAFSSWYGQDCCQWDDVECRPSTSTVVKLLLYDKRDQNLPEKWYPNATLFAQFKDLQELHLEGNNIGGFTSPSGSLPFFFFPIYSYQVLSYFTTYTPLSPCLFDALD
ncbi:hypothetical protein ACSBR2_010595 [Camellia fascicularis]